MFPPRDYCREKDCIQEERMAREQINLGINLKDGLPYTEWSKEQMKVRRANGGREDPHSYCMPPNFPRAWTLPQHSRIVQTPGMMVVLHEFNAAYREIYLDGRPLPANPNPTWNGYSTGRWEGDTLVIETNGIRDDMWLDIQGSPVTESARVTERLTRPSLGLMKIEIAVNDPKAYTRPWSVTIEMGLIVDTQMLEEICISRARQRRTGYKSRSAYSISNWRRSSSLARRWRIAAACPAPITASSAQGHARHTSLPIVLESITM